MSTTDQDNFMDLEQYLSDNKGTDVINFSWFSDDPGMCFDAAREYAHKLREVYTEAFGERAPQITCEGVRVIITSNSSPCPSRSAHETAKS